MVDALFALGTVYSLRQDKERALRRSCACSRSSRRTPGPTTSSARCCSPTAGPRKRSPTSSAAWPRSRSARPRTTSSPAPTGRRRSRGGPARDRDLPQPGSRGHRRGGLARRSGRAASHAVRPLVALMVCLLAASARAQPHGEPAVEQRTRQGWEMLKAGRAREAAEAFRAAIAADRGFATAHLGLGVACASLGQDDEAIAAFRQAIRLRPGYVEAHYNLGVALDRTSRLDEARAAFEAALELRPGDANALFNLGRVHGRLEHWPDAAGAYERAIAARPSMRPPTLVWASPPRTWAAPPGGGARWKSPCGSSPTTQRPLRRSARCTETSSAGRTRWPHSRRRSRSGRTTPARSTSSAVPTRASGGRRRRVARSSRHSR